MNVLILTDFSEVSDNAGKYAVDFLKEKEANFFLLNIQEFDPGRPAMAKITAELALTNDNLEKAITSLKKHSTSSRHFFEPVYSSDNLINAVRKTLIEKQIDLMFIGAASQDVHKHAILGDHAYEVVRKIQCTIMAVPGSCSYHRAQRIMLPVDYSVISRERVLSQLENTRFLEIGCLTIIELDQKEEREPVSEIAWSRAAQVPDGKGGNYLRLSESQVYNEKLLLEIQKRFDMIVIMGRNLSVCDHFLHSRYGLVANFKNSLPIMVLHEC